MPEAVATLRLSNCADMGMRAVFSRSSNGFGLAVERVATGFVLQHAIGLESDGG